ncbi:hypothetical protein PIB30_051810 [Stylosanthes scabra]|uniref:Uncharacterized protein n=1 Tax=Stylosanthes scabra TaxID=79078 RepID=A0ABU6VJ25_9FABA|nr:hypothetical protein [Stylosanthes scabra]
MGEGGGRRKGVRDGRGRGEGGDGPPTQQSQGGQDGPSTSYEHDAGMSTQAEVPSTPQTQQNVATPTIASLSQAFLDRAPSPGFQQMMKQILLPVVPTPLASPALAEHRDEPPARGRGRRIPRHRGCGTGGHI